MILDITLLLAKRRADEKRAARQAEDNQRMSSLLGKNPLLAINPTALGVMLGSQEAQDGMA